MNNKLVCTYGSDPELMLQDSASRIVSAIGVLKNDKNSPHILEDGSRLYADNVLCEMAFNPAKSPREAVDKMRTVLFKAQQRLGDGLTFAAKAAHLFDGLPPKPTDELVEQWLRDEVPSDAVAPEWQVGCNPNYDVYSDSIRKQRPFADALRTGSFHIHVGNANYRSKSEFLLLTDESKKEAIRLLDIYLGCLSIIFDKDDTSKARKALYGKAGEYRPTRYGIEYRVLGNYALRSPAMTLLCFEVVEWVMQYVGTDFAKSLLDRINPFDVQRCINESNVELAKTITHKAMMPWRFILRAEDAKPITVPLRETWGF